MASLLRSSALAAFMAFSATTDALAKERVTLAPDVQDMINRIDRYCDDSDFRKSMIKCLGATGQTIITAMESLNALIDRETGRSYGLDHLKRNFGRAMINAACDHVYDYTNTRRPLILEDIIEDFITDVDHCLQTIHFHYFGFHLGRAPMDMDDRHYQDRRGRISGAAQILKGVQDGLNGLRDYQDNLHDRDRDQGFERRL